MTVKFYGNWAAARDASSFFHSKEFSEIIYDLLDSLGEETVDALRSHIDDNDLDWAPLSELTIKLKGGLDTIMFDKGGYRQSMTYNISELSEYTWSLFVYPKGNNPDRNVPYHRIAFWHEYGTKYMPSRKLWRPVFNEIFHMKSFKHLKKTGILMAKAIANRKSLEYDI